MAADPSRLVDVRGVLATEPGAAARTRQGSGLIVAHGLVLTAAHVVSSGAGWLTVRVRAAGSSSAYDAEVVWPPEPGSLDVAILRVVDPPAEWPTTGVRWGRFTGRAGDRPVDAAGYPEVVRDADRREVHHLVGRVNPQAGLEGGRLRLEVTSEPAASGTAASPWGGFSGAALMSGDLVVGVVVIDTPGFAHRVLTAVPARSLLAHDEVRRLLGAHSVGDSVELDGLLEPRSRIAAPRSPAQLLRAEQEAIAFRGRERELDVLTQWAVEPAQLGLRLVTGPGGRGKTRLAQELVHRIGRDPTWVTGVLEGAGRGDRDLVRVVETTRDLRVLLMVDYAESRVDQVCDILCAAERSMDPPHLRLLLLARDSGDWWQEDLLQRHQELEDIAEHLALPELHPVSERTDQFVACAREFARRLPEIQPDVDWAHRLESATPPDLTEAGYGDPLSIQLAAMLALLGVDGGVGTGSLETRLIRHEKSYWQHVLDVRGIALETHVRDQAVAAATLFSVGGRAAALRILGRVPELSAPGPVATWLAELYPHATHYWGALQPDRLGEHHIGDVSKRSPDFLQELFDETPREEAEGALVVIGRAMAHQPHMEEQVRRLIDHGTPGIAEALRGAARFVPNPRLFLRGLGERDVVDADVYTPMHDSSAMSGGAAARSAPRDLEEEAARLRAMTAAQPGVPIAPWHVATLMDLVDNRRQAGEPTEALTTVQEVIALLSSSGDHGGLAHALIVRSGVEVDLGMLERALASAHEAMDAAQRLLARAPGDDRARETMGRALSSLAALMQKAGRNQEGLKYSAEAVDLLRSLEWAFGFHDPQVLLRAEVTHGSIEASLGDFEAARATLESAVGRLDQIVRAEPEPSPDTIALRAVALSNLGACLGEMGEVALAVRALAAAVEDYSRLDDVQLAPEVARTALNLAEMAERHGDLELAVEAAQRTVTEISRWEVPVATSTEAGLRYALLGRASYLLGRRAHPG